MTTFSQKIQALKALEQPDGHIDPAAVVAAAQDIGHVLHEHFEWNDGAAAQKYRLAQAQSLIRSIKLDVTVGTVPLTVPAYVRDLRADTSGYRALLIVRNEEEIARATVIDAMHRASNAIRRAKTLATLFGIEDLVDEAHALIQQITERARDINDQPAGAA